jgi:hypothetical protein
MPEYLPKTSDELPVLGIILIVSLVVIAAVLMATILVLMCYHSEGTPSSLIQRMFFPFKFWSIKLHQNNNATMNHGMDTEMQETETNDIASATDEEPPCKDNVGEEEVTWQEIAKKLNWLFFCFFTVVLLLICLVVLVVY